MNNVELAVSYLKNGGICSQAVFSAYCEELGLDRETACKIATPFGGGIARMGETCGAVTGALMVIGLKYGNVFDRKNEVGKKDETYAYTLDFAKRFKDRNGSLKCRDLLGCEIGSPEGRELFQTACPKFVRDAAEILEGILIG